MIKRLLALIPRPIVRLFPRSVRDRIRTPMLRLERRIRRGRRTGTGDRRQLAAIETRVMARFDRLEHALAGLERRLDDTIAELGQLDSRLSISTSGDAPTPVDDLRALVAPIEALRAQLEAQGSDGGDLSPVGQPTADGARRVADA